MWIASNVVGFTWKLLFRFHWSFFFLEWFMWGLAASATDRWFNARTRWSVWRGKEIFLHKRLHVLVAYVKYDVKLTLRNGLFPRLVPFAFFELFLSDFLSQKGCYRHEKVIRRPKFALCCSWVLEKLSNDQNAHRNTWTILIKNVNDHHVWSHATLPSKQFFVVLSRTIHFLDLFVDFWFKIVFITSL